MKNTYWSRQCLAAPPHSGCSWTKCGKIFDAGCTTSHVSNFGVNEPNVTKISHKVKNWWPTKALKLEFQYCNLDGHQSRSQKVSVWPVRWTGSMGWSPTWLDLMPSIPSSSFQVSLSSFDPFKCTFWDRTDKWTDRHTHTHTRQNLYILATRAVKIYVIINQQIHFHVMIPTACIAIKHCWSIVLDSWQQPISTRVTGPYNPSWHTHELSSQMASQLVQLFLQGPWLWATHTQSDRPRYLKTSVVWKLNRKCNYTVTVKLL